MRSAIEFERLFQSNTTKWHKTIDKRIAEFKKAYPQITQDWVDSIILSRLEKRLERLVGIWDRNHPHQDGFRKNNYLADLFAQLHQARTKYRVSPFGNFFMTDFPALKSKHQQQATSHPMWYAYRPQAFDWTIDEVIAWCALHFVLNARLQAYRNPEITTDQQKPDSDEYRKSMSAKIRERSGQMNGVEVAKYLGKSPATITRWVADDYIPHKRQHGKAVFFVVEIDKWLRTLNKPY